jgi:hypothetical protein
MNVTADPRRKGVPLLPLTQLTIFREEDGSSPLLNWLAKLEPKARSKCIAAIFHLAEHGRDLRRPQVDFLRDGIYELRVQRRGIQFRILYAFTGKDIILLTHGLVKEEKVPGMEIDRALKRLRAAEKKPGLHILSIDEIGPA